MPLNINPSFWEHCSRRRPPSPRTMLKSQRAAPIKSRSGFDGRLSSEHLWTDACVIATFLRQASPKRRHVGMIWNMYVSEERRGTGLADILFKHVLEAASQKVDQVELYVAVENPRGSKFYRKFGFESYAVMPRALRVQGADFDALMMVKKFR